MTAKEKVKKARSLLVLDDPFFGSLVLRLKVEEDSGCQTLRTDGIDLEFNPKFVDSVSMEVLEGCLCHEVMHCALSHHTRRGSRDSKKWNVACDYAVNPLIVDKFALPDGVLINPAFSGLSAEEIYSKLPDQGQGQDDSGSDGSQDQDDSSSDPGGCGEVRDLPGEDGGLASAADLSKSESEWRVAVAQAAQQAKAFGSLPAGVSRVVEDIVNPKVDWRSILHRFMDTVSKSDYSWSPPNRRHIHSGLYLPSCREQQLGTVVVAVDTSGSINQESLDLFASELSAILQDFRAETYVIYCDSNIQGIDHFYQGDFPDNLNPKGGGGTDFRPVFEWIDKENINPACVIYFTDLDGRFPEVSPMFPVLWVTDQKGVNDPGFGEVLEI
jgi:predicted metal-dependent peptidase